MEEKEYVMGLDCSTSVVGITIMDTSGKLIELNHVAFPAATKKQPKLTIFQKADYFKNALVGFQNYNIKICFIEEPLKNGPDINTTILLAKFNGILSQIIHEKFNIEPIYLSVYDARKIFFPEFIKTETKKGISKQILSFPTDSDKKKLVFDKVSWLEPQVEWLWSKFFNLKTENYDRADSYVVTKAGLYSIGYIKNIPKCPILFGN